MEPATVVTGALQKTKVKGKRVTEMPFWMGQSGKVPIGDTFMRKQNV